MSRAGVRASGPLSEREAQVATLIVEGLTNKEIGARLGLGREPVKSCVRGALEKLGVTNRTQIAVRLATGRVPRGPVVPVPVLPVVPVPVLLALARELRRSDLDEWQARMLDRMLDLLDAGAES